MRIPGLKGLRLGARWLRSRFVGEGLILGYHRVADVARDTYSLCVTPQHFAEQLQVLHKYTQPISLRQLAKGLLDGNLPKRSVVVTFDDGYADVVDYAAPLLERYQIPATVFVSTGYVGREFWWDELERIVLSAAVLPDELSLDVKVDSSRRCLSHAGRRRAWPQGAPPAITICVLVAFAVRGATSGLGALVGLGWDKVKRCGSPACSDF